MLHERWPYVIVVWPHSRVKVVRVKLSWIFSSWYLWQGRKSRAAEDAKRFLLRPRGWVWDQVQCFQRRHHLPTHGFASVYIRDSVEKRRELQAHGHRLPPVVAFFEIALIVARELDVTVRTVDRMALDSDRRGSTHPRAGNSEGSGDSSYFSGSSGGGAEDVHALRGSHLATARTVVLHTSSQGVHSNFSAFGQASGLAVVSTANARSDHDEWHHAGMHTSEDATPGSRPSRPTAASNNSGQPAASATMQGTIGAVNAELASRAGVLIALRFSAWTDLIRTLMNVPEEEDTVFCCECSAREARYNRGNLVVILARALSPSQRKRVQDALRQARIAQCRVIT